VMPGSSLAGHNSPSGGWFLELFTRTLDLYERYGFPLPVEESIGNFQVDLALIRRDLVAHPNSNGTDLRHLIAIEGRWPSG